MKKNIYLVAAALALVATLGIGSAMAYFTTYVTADGGVKLSMGSTVTVPEEKMDLHFKLVTVQNTGDNDCYVRVKAFAGAEYDDLKYSDEDGKWTPGADGYYYYSDIVPAGGETSVLKIEVKALDGTTPEAGESFNVIVVQESTPVSYDAAGNPSADWDAEAEILNKEVE